MEQRQVSVNDLLLKIGTQAVEIDALRKALAEAEQRLVIAEQALQALTAEKSAEPEA